MLLRTFILLLIYYFILFHTRGRYYSCTDCVYVRFVGYDISVPHCRHVCTHWQIRNMSHITWCVRSYITHFCTKFHTLSSHSSLDIAVKPNVKDLRNSVILLNILEKKCLKTQSVDHPTSSFAPSSKISAFGMSLLLSTKLEYIWFADNRIQFISRENWSFGLLRLTCDKCRSGGFAEGWRTQIYRHARTASEPHKSSCS